MKSFYLICYHRVVALKKLQYTRVHKVRYTDCTSIFCVVLDSKVPFWPPWVVTCSQQDTTCTNKIFHRGSVLNKVVNSQLEPALLGASGWEKPWKEASSEAEWSRSLGAKVHNYVSNRCGKEGGAATRCLVSVWVKKGINRTIKKAYLY